jgi:hypothetical protein
MKSLMLVLAGSLALAPLAVAQDHAVPRGGGGGGSSSGGGGGHPGVSSSGGGSSSGGTTTTSGGSSSSSGSSGSSSTAERRHPRAGTGRGGYGGGYYPGYPGYYPGYDGWYYPGWYGSYWWPYGSYGWYGGYWGYPGGWGGGWGGGTAYRNAQREPGAIRVLVDPSEARVYVDGYYAGIVDDFDGLFQRLNASSGRHEITLKLEGYKTHRMKVYVTPDSTLKLHYNMQKGSGETFEDLAGNVPDRELRRDREGDDQRWSERERRDRPDDSQASGAAGKLRLRVQPADASVYVDGAFRGSGREASLLQLPAGRHRVEVVRPGFRTVERDVEITAGDTIDLAVELDRTSI